MTDAQQDQVAQDGQENMMAANGNQGEAPEAAAQPDQSANPDVAPADAMDDMD